uniref:Transporter n=1 Tax=Chelydra serpentina TaxID=8475 RepID=A0A8C3TD07_CHESE
MKWDNKFQYILSCVGFAVGLGNVWRFPYLCQIYGGGAFLIPYVIALVFEGIPLFHLELAIGQRMRKGSIGVWNTISPYFGGVGIMLLHNYCSHSAWEMRYCLHFTLDSLVILVILFFSGHIEECHESTAVNYFWYRRALNISSDITDSGNLQWWLVLCLAICWSIVYICTIRGIESTGKAIYVTAIFPYLVLTIFLIRGLTLPGATEGLVYLFTPNLNILKNPRVWLDAATQIFFSLSLAFGGLISSNCQNQHLFVILVNMTSLYASIPIFSILGFKGTTGYWDCLDRNIISIINEFDLQDQSIMRDNYTIWLEFLNTTHPKKITSLKLRSCDLQEFLDASGTGLAFIVFTEAIILMPGSQGWAVLFFVMLFSLGLSSMFGNIEGILTPLLELRVVSKSVPKEVLSGAICLVSFVTALCFTLRSGSYWLEVFDSYAGSLPLLIIAFFEVTGVVYVYGIKRFSDDVKWMTGRQPNFYWQVSWRIISPLLMLTVFIAFVTLQTQKQPSYGAWNPKYVCRPIFLIHLFSKKIVTIFSYLPMFQN